jgi:folate-dependent phosphoribosylglycinamide formyltransferase PurN
VFRSADNSFTISGVKLRQLMDALPTGMLNISVNLVSADGEFAAVYEFAVSRGVHEATRPSARPQQDR